MKSQPIAIDFLQPTTSDQRTWLRQTSIPVGCFGNKWLMFVQHCKLFQTVSRLLYDHLMHRLQLFTTANDAARRFLTHGGGWRCCEQAIGAEP